MIGERAVKQMIIAGSMCLLTMAVSAQNAAENIEIKFEIQSQKTEDGTGDIRAGMISLTRGKLGADPYMLRAYTDIPVTPGAAYELSYAVKVEGGGSAQGIVFSGDQQQKWNESTVKYTVSKKKCAFTKITSTITASKETFYFRIDLRASGADTTVAYKDVVLNRLGEQKDGKTAVAAETADSGPGVLKNGKLAEDLTGWVVECPGSDSGNITAENGALKVVRISGNAFMRIFQDVLLDPKKEYAARYQVKVVGTGSARVWTYSGDEKFKWDESKCIFNAAQDQEWVNKEIALPPGFGSVRICFSADGNGTTAWFRNIELVEKGAEATAK